MTELELQAKSRDPDVHDNTNTTTTVNNNTTTTTTPTSNNTTTKTKKRSRTHVLVLLVVLTIAVAIALTVGLVLNSNKNDDDSNDDERDEPRLRSGVIVDCLPELRREKDKMQGGRERCYAMGCEWARQEARGAPWCFYPALHGYRIAGSVVTTPNGYFADLGRIGTPWDSSLGHVFSSVRVEVTRQTPDRLRIKMFPTDVSRYEVPSDALDIEKTSHDNAVNETLSLFNVTFTDEPFGVVVRRTATGTVVFNTSLPGTVLSDQFLQVTTRLATDQLFGFGEHRHVSLLHSMHWKRWSMFTRDSGPNSDWNLYGHHPVYMNVEEDGRANMVLFKNTNAMGRLRRTVKPIWFSTKTQTLWVG
ncbi:sucrase-isomaltase, intestinal-like [Elysia marginata]|uniref:Sucrase-isomaltase, intestinal-like n=1 Tax=Elysia marginata TaxID=1093978 RepID=A0AAV4HSW0_9GAST|nr:sucrase-isomaltase, intestinal-like [Elysia marginata]